MNGAMRHCENCGVVWDEPHLPESLVHEVLQLRRSNKTLLAAKRLSGGCSELRHAKAIAMHITLEPGKCHRCGAQLRVPRECPKCNAFNYDW